LLLSHLLHLRGIDSVVLDHRTRDEIESTVRAGVLEQGTVDLLAESGVGERLQREAFFHRGIYLRFGGATHEIDMQALTGGKRVTIYPQHEVLKDLIHARLQADGRIFFGAADVALDGVDSDRPALRFRERGEVRELACDFVAGCDGSHGPSREWIPAAAVARYERAYPYAWLGVSVEAPRSSDLLIYASHARGFALLSTRSPTLQRMYVQCDPHDRLEDWPDARIWDELHARTEAQGWNLQEGPITQKLVFGMRSAVTEPMRYRRLFLAGDAAHVVPPTGAKGLNLAVADVRVLAQALARFYESGDSAALDDYSATCLRRVWNRQRFSVWMTTILHRDAAGSPFDERRRLAELDHVVTSPHARASLAESYVGVRSLFLPRGKSGTDLRPGGPAPR
jgi:p-hydroxybenzoate 3-monooxygenase